MNILWVIAIVLILPASIASITWAFSVTKEQIKQDDKISTAEIRLEKLEKEINQKLDILIKRNEQ